METTPKLTKSQRRRRRRLRQQGWSKNQIRKLDRYGKTPKPGPEVEKVFDEGSRMKSWIYHKT